MWINFVMETLINLFCCQEKMFIHMNTWIAVKDLMKNHYQIKKTFYSKLYLEDIVDKDYEHAQKVFKEFNLKKSW